MGRSTPSPFERSLLYFNNLTTSALQGLGNHPSLQAGFIHSVRFMPGTGSRPPPVAFVEDYDDDAQTTLFSTRETANVTAKRAQAGLSTRLHDGSDSGYSSKAPTVGSASTGAGKMASLKIDTSLRERERHPYIVSAGGNAVRRETVTRPRASTNGQAPAHVEPFVHPKGLCMTCDQYGKHIELPYPTVQSPLSVSPQVPKKPSATPTKQRQATDPRLKRYSSHQSTPTTSYAQHPASQPVFPPSPYAQTPGWSMPATPMVYTYATTPLTSTYVGPPSQTSYFDPPPASDPRPPISQRRSSQYGDPVIQQALRDDRKAVDVRSSHRKEARPTRETHHAEDYYGRPSAAITQEKYGRPPASSARDYDSRPAASVTRDYDSLPVPSLTRDYDSRPVPSLTRDNDDHPPVSMARVYDDRSYDSFSGDYDDEPTPSPGRDRERVPITTAGRKVDRRPHVSTHQSSQSIDRDRKAMPPPERPSKQPEVARRPGLVKSSTYNPEIVHHRRSRTADEYEHAEMRAPPSPRTREAPPSAYRGPQPPDPTQSRPQPTRKSASYADPVSVTRVAESKHASNNESHPRRNTNSPTSMEHKAVEAEAYQRSRSNMTSDELVAEKLNTLKKQRSNTLSSETGSAYSHRESHHSSSRGSSGKGRSHTSGQRTSILIDKGIKVDVPADYERKGRPVSIDLGGGMTLSFGAKDKDNKKDPKMIEKAPSVASHASKKSTSTASHDVPTHGREHDESSRSSRRPSHNEERRPPVTDRSHKTSRPHSRAPSTSRASRRQSADYSGGYSAY